MLQNSRTRARALRKSDGPRLLEFALILPLLLVVAVGSIDLAASLVLRRQLTNAAREGARIAVSQPDDGLDQAAPAAVQAVRNAVVSYMANAGLDTSFIPATPAKTGVREWTYAGSSGGPALVIKRGATTSVTSGSVPAPVVATEVTVQYPFSWTFSRVLRLMAPDANYADSFAISTNVLMENSAWEAVGPSKKR
jgi:Flp pilus assembly protein TadG